MERIVKTLKICFAVILAPFQELLSMILILLAIGGISWLALKMPDLWGWAFSVITFVGGLVFLFFLPDIFQKLKNRIFGTNKT